MPATRAADFARDGVVAGVEHPTDVLRTINYVTQGLTLFFVTSFVCIRFASKHRSGLGWALDDYLTAISWFLMTGYCICGIMLSVYGGGYHIWEVPASNMESFFKTGYAITLFYAPMTCFVKLSLLTIIACVFSPYRMTIIGIYVLDAILIGYYISQFVVKARICLPVSAYWEGDVSKCLDQAAIIMADSIMSVVTDIIILVLPLPLTWSLQLPRKKKIRVAGMLCAGGLATAFGAYRLHLVIHSGKSTDQTIVFIQIVLSGNAEAGIGLICTCLPAAAALFRKVAGSLGYAYGSQHNASRSYQLSGLSGARAAKERFTNLEEASACTDEVTLVRHAQQQDLHDRDVDSNAGLTGIMRKVEVTHTISVASSSEERQSSEKDISNV